MEVHHHPHVEKKSFKEYLLEGLMIFLAVSMGFIAENIREYLSEREREHVYMQNMTADLQSDTVMYSNSRKNLSEGLNMFDSLISILSSNEAETKSNKAYFYARLITTKFDKLVFKEATYDQMKSSGDLRLIHHKKVANSVADYYNTIKIINSQNNITDYRTTDYMTHANKIFDAKTMYQIFKDRKEPQNSKLVKTDRELINEFLMSAQYYYGSLSLLAKWGSERNEKAKQLLELIKKEYHLEKE